MKTFGNLLAVFGFLCIVADFITPIGAIAISPFFLLLYLWALGEDKRRKIANALDKGNEYDPETGYRKLVYEIDPVTHNRIYTEYGKTVQHLAQYQN
jgi:hypothetical protein